MIVYNRPIESDDVSFLISLSNTCEAFHSLPRQGGIFDQDAILISGMQLVRSAQSEKERNDARNQRAEMEAQKSKAGM